MQKEMRESGILEALLGWLSLNTGMIKLHENVYDIKRCCVIITPKDSGFSLKWVWKFMIAYRKHSRKNFLKKLQFL